MSKVCLYSLLFRCASRSSRERDAFAQRNVATLVEKPYRPHPAGVASRSHSTRKRNRLSDRAEVAFAPPQPKKTAAKKANAPARIKAAKKTAAKKTTANVTLHLNPGISRLCHQSMSGI